MNIIIIIIIIIIYVDESQCTRCDHFRIIPNFTNTHNTTQCNSSTFHKDKEELHCVVLCVLVKLGTWLNELQQPNNRIL